MEKNNLLGELAIVIKDIVSDMSNGSVSLDKNEFIESLESYIKLSETKLVILKCRKDDVKSVAMNIGIEELFQLILQYQEVMIEENPNLLQFLNNLMLETLLEDLKNR